jgi:2-keto-4-pentenoate hydratase
MIGVEAELAFRIGRDLKPRSEPMISEEIWASIASVHAAIEIVDTRLANWKYADRLWVLADSQSNGGFVYDPNGVPLTDGSFADAPVRLEFDGRVVVEKRGGNPAGDPRWLVEWLTNHCAQSRGGLMAGQFVTTGSYTGMLFVAAGAAVMASFKGIGTVTVSFP